MPQVLGGPSTISQLAGLHSHFFEYHHCEQTFILGVDSLGSIEKVSGTAANLRLNSQSVNKLTSWVVSRENNLHIIIGCVATGRGLRRWTDGWATVGRQALAARSECRPAAGWNRRLGRSARGVAYGGQPSHNQAWLVYHNIAVQTFLTVSMTDCR